MLPEALGQAIGQILAEQRKEWNRERDRIETESRATVASLNAEIANLKVANEMLRVDLRNAVDVELTRVRDALAQIKDGRDGDPGPQGEKGADADPAVIERMVANALAKLPPAENGEPGPPGDPGRDGKDVDPAVLDAAIAAHVAKAIAEVSKPVDGAPGIDGKDGRDGADGKDADPEIIRQIVADAVAELPPPQKGDPGVDGRDGVDGKDADPELVRALVGETVATAIAALPPPERGEKGEKGDPGRDGADGVGLAGALINRSGEFVVTLTDGSTRELGVIIGAPGKDGRDGKDGLSFDAFTLVPEYDGERTLRVKWSDAKGNEQVRELRMPIMLYREIYKADASYEVGDAVRYGGSLWLAVRDTAEKPGDGCKDWRLVARAGRDGRDGAPGAKGEKGDPGRPGRDFTLMGKQS